VQTIRVERQLLLPIVCIVLLGLVSLWFRPLMPVDETRYISVAWEMWLQNSWWLPTRNFEAYAHKPPLLFWLIHLGWGVFGVNEWWPRLLSPLLACCNLLLVSRMAARLWPEQRAIAVLAPAAYASSWYLLAMSTWLMFDMLMTACVLLALLGLVKIGQGRRQGWILFPLGVALGLLAKGPAIFVYTLPALLAWPFWCDQPAPRLRRYLALLGATLAACVPILIWVYLVSRSVSAEKLNELLFEQTSRRLSGDLGHGRPWWWYLPYLLLLPLPWTLWPSLWRGTPTVAGQQMGRRFAWVVVGSGILIFSAVGGKQVHYLLPILAVFCVLIGRTMAGLSPRKAGDSTWLVWVMALFLLILWLPIPIKDPDTAVIFQQVRPWFSLALGAITVLLLLTRHRVAQVPVVQLASSALVTGFFAAGFSVLAPNYQLQPPARIVAAAQQAGRPVAFVGFYQAEFSFLGRLAAPIDSIEAAQGPAWVQAHPHGLVVGRSKRIEVLDAPVVLHQPYRGGELLIIDAAVAQPERVRFVH
jgi:4-amino-4-deoxy-L-arabinose transferase-like glycosyltransferase